MRGFFERKFALKKTFVLSLHDEKGIKDNGIGRSRKITQERAKEMKLDKYELKSGEQLEVFEFVSIGTKGRIAKIVQYTPTNYKNLYNIGFGDKNIETGEVDDLAISNNGDSEKVLATVVASLFAFIDRHKEAMVYATGSTKVRTRLYRMGISKYLDEIKKDFEVYGELESGWEEFREGVEYEAFLVKLKIIDDEIKSY